MKIAEVYRDKMIKDISRLAEKEEHVYGSAAIAVVTSELALVMTKLFPTLEEYADFLDRELPE